MLPDEMIQARKAALLVHALPTSARDAVLAQLSEPQRLRLQGLLDELQVMNVPAGRDWLRYIEDVPPVEGQDAEVVRALQLAGASRMAQVFEQQPPEVVAAVVGAAAWRWRTEALEALPAQQRIAVNALLADNRRLAQAVTQRLLVLCLEALRALPPQPQQPVQPPEAGGLKSRLHSFFF